MQHPLPGTSLIIPSRNRRQLLRGTVQSVLAGRYLPAELIIIDQSDQPDIELSGLRSDNGCSIRYQWTSTPGVSRARNAGIEAATHDILVFTDDDMTVSDDWFGSIVNALRSVGPKGVVTGRVLPGEFREDGGFAPSIITEKVATQYSGRIGIDVLYSNNMALHRTAFEELGRFDERLGPGTRYLGAEDNDFCFRLLESGYTIYYVPEAVLYHLAWRGPSDVLPLQWSYGYGQGAYLAKHATFRDRYMLNRFGRGLLDSARSVLRSLLFERRIDREQVVYGSALLMGFVRWTLSAARTRTNPGTR